MTNQEISLTPAVKSKPVIGMMRHFARPNHLAVAAAFSAKMIDCEFFFFTPNDINFNNRKIEGFFYEDGQWVKRLTNFPDVVDNSPSRNSTRAIYEELEKHVPLTMRRIGNKNIVNKRILDDGIYSDLIIPFCETNNITEILAFLQRYEKIVIKPAGGNQGKGIRFIKKNNETYIEMRIIQRLKWMKVRLHLI